MFQALKFKAAAFRQTAPLQPGDLGVLFFRACCYPMTAGAWLAYSADLLVLRT